MVSRVFMGHGIKNDSLDGSKTPHGDPEHQEAYQIGYDAGLRKFNRHVTEKELVRPNNDGIDWDIDPAKACNLDDPECEACQ